jgi:hypothetical protein
MDALEAAIRDIAREEALKVLGDVLGDPTPRLKEKAKRNDHLSPSAGGRIHIDPPSPDF